MKTDWTEESIRAIKMQAVLFADGENGGYERHYTCPIDERITVIQAGNNSDGHHSAFLVDGEVVFEEDRGNTTKDVHSTNICTAIERLNAKPHARK